MQLDTDLSLVSHSIFGMLDATNMKNKDFDDEDTNHLCSRLNLFPSKFVKV